MARNDYFATMFRTDKFIEGKSKSVDMSHCSKAVMEKIIKFIFSGVIKFSDLSLTQLLELSHMSEMMLLANIKAEVDNYAKRVISNALLLDLIQGLKFADQYNLSSLKRSINCELNYELNGIPNDFECADAFRTLQFDLIQDLFMDSRLSSWRPTPIERLEVFMIWLSKNEVTEEQKNKIVESFDLDNFKWRS